MANRRDAEPSPLRAGAVHTGLSLLVFGGIAGALGAAIILMGDPSEASPKQAQIKPASKLGRACGLLRGCVGLAYI